MNRFWTFTNLTARDRDKICCLYQEERLSEKLIGIRFNLTEAGVRRVLRECGIPTRGAGRRAEGNSGNSQRNMA